MGMLWISSIAIKITSLTLKKELRNIHTSYIFSLYQCPTKSLPHKSYSANYFVYFNGFFNPMLPEYTQQSHLSIKFRHWGFKRWIHDINIFGRTTQSLTHYGRIPTIKWNPRKPCLGLLGFIKDKKCI